MKVKELIELLSKFNEDLDVVGSYNGGEYYSDLEMLKVRRVWNERKGKHDVVLDD